MVSSSSCCQNISIDVIGGTPKPYCSGNICRECVIDRHCSEGFVCRNFSCELPADDIPIPTIGCLDPLALNFNDGTYRGEYTCPDSEKIQMVNGMRGKTGQRKSYKKRRRNKLSTT